jgi:hypothetical protein
MGNAPKDFMAPDGARVLTQPEYERHWQEFDLPAFERHIVELKIKLEKLRQPYEQEFEEFMRDWTPGDGPFPT